MEGGLMASPSIFKRVMDTFQSIMKGALRAFKPENDAQPKMGIMPLKHDIYKKGTRNFYT